MKHRKRYNLGVGAVVSLFISLLASVPRILKASDMDYRTLAVNIIYGFTLALFCWVFHHFVIHTRLGWKWAETPWVKYSLSITLAIVFSLGYHEIVSRFIQAAPFLLENVPEDRKLATLIFRGLLVSGFVFFVTYYLHVSGISQQSKLENERLKQENLQARLNSLKQQISPHFLFNTLNTLSSLTKEPKVKEYIAEISNVYRYLLHYKESDMVTVDAELKFIDSYLYILRERFEGGLHVTIDISDQTKKTLIPPLALQTLVENAVKHNVISGSKPLLLDITDNQSCIVVRNNLQIKQSMAHESSQSGLNNINERYKLLLNKEIIIERTAQFFTVKLPVLY